jgi:hypothetical protein
MMSNEEMNDWMRDLRAGEIEKARKLVCQKASVDEYEEIYRHMYENLNYWSDDKEIQKQAVIIIRNALVNHVAIAVQSLVNHVAIADAEINLSACFVELEMLRMGREAAPWVIEKVEELENSLPRWIPVEEQRPELGKLVQVS